MGVKRTCDTTQSNVGFFFSDSSSSGDEMSYEIWALNLLATSNAGTIRTNEMRERRNTAIFLYTNRSSVDVFSSTLLPFGRYSNVYRSRRTFFFVEGSSKKICKYSIRCGFDFHSFNAFLCVFEICVYSFGFVSKKEGETYLTSVFLSITRLNEGWGLFLLLLLRFVNDFSNPLESNTSSHTL